ncbi:MAG TPA: hypothetical protein VJ810_21970 [Blastocatellia bacterium]|nr:hypothetical protein [Blastocatellia bacterium]
MKHKVTLLEDDDCDLNDDIAPEFDLASMKRATEQERKYRAQASGHLVRIAPDVAAVFDTPKAVNEALRALIRLMGDLKQASEMKDAA